MESSNFDLNEFCRTCGIERQLTSFSYIFESSSRANNTIDSEILSIISILRLNFEKDDGLPQEICECCQDVFKAINDFCNKCLQVERIFLTMQELTMKADNDIIKETGTNNDTIKDIGTDNETNPLFCEDILGLADDILKDEDINQLAEIVMTSETNANSLSLDCKSENQSDLLDWNESYYSEHEKTINDSCSECGICSLSVTKCEFDGQSKSADSELETFYAYGNQGFNQWMKKDSHGKGHLDVKPYLCETPDESDNNRSSPSSHQIAKHEKDASKISTPNDYRGEKYNAKSIKLHGVTNTKHRIFKCLICGKEYMKKFSLQQHMHFAHTENENGENHRIKCPLCSKGFATSTGLKSHIKMHTECRPYKCEECSSAFKRREQLTSHKRRVHIKDKRFCCPHCEKKYTENFELNAHMKNHSDERPFKCSFCPLTFKWRASLNGHQLRHTGRKPHTCLVCRNAFRTAKSLQTHTSRHTISQIKFVHEVISNKLNE